MLALQILWVLVQFAGEIAQMDILNVVQCFVWNQQINAQQMQGILPQHP